MKQKFVYLVKINNEEFAIIGNNIADVCDKLDIMGIKGYEFIHSKSFQLID